MATHHTTRRVLDLPRPFLPPLPSKIKADPNSKRSRKKLELEQLRQDRAADHEEQIDQPESEPV
eukprot:1628159-Pyramimonas_sp.AAC.1